MKDKISLLVALVEPGVQLLLEHAISIWLRKLIILRRNSGFPELLYAWINRQKKSQKIGVVQFCLTRQKNPFTTWPKTTQNFVNTV